MKIYLIIFISFMLNCHGQKVSPGNPVTRTNLSNQIIQEDTIMMDRENVKLEYYDFQITQNGTRSVTYERGDGWLIELWAMKNLSCGICTEFAPAAEFCEIQKNYFLTGMIKERGKYMSEVAFGKQEYFDEKGKCIKITDEDKKFGAIKREDILQLLEEEGWFNRLTGENIITENLVLPLDYSFYREIKRYMTITFKRAEIDSWGTETEPPKWFIEIEPRHGMNVTQYIIDGNTGKFEKTETFMPREE